MFLGELSPRTGQGATSQKFVCEATQPPSLPPLLFTGCAQTMRTGGTNLQALGKNPLCFQVFPSLLMPGTGQSVGLQLGPRGPQLSIPGRDHDLWTTCVQMLRKAASSGPVSALLPCAQPLPLLPCHEGWGRGGKTAKDPVPYSSHDAVPGRASTRTSSRPGSCFSRLPGMRSETKKTWALYLQRPRLLPPTGQISAWLLQGWGRKEGPEHREGCPDAEPHLRCFKCTATI